MSTARSGAWAHSAILAGSVLAIRTERLKLVIAYSTMAQLGVLFLVWPLAGGADGEMAFWAAGRWTGAMVHGLAEALGHDRIDGRAGIGHALLLTTFSFGLAAVSLMGLAGGLYELLQIGRPEAALDGLE